MEGMASLSASAFAKQLFSQTGCHASRKWANFLGARHYQKFVKVSPLNSVSPTLAKTNHTAIHSVAGER
jgi:hypothetical protein